MEIRGEPRPLVTDTNRAPVIQVVTWLLLAANFLAVTLRVLTRFYLKSRLKFDDLFIVIAFVRPASLLTFPKLNTTNADELINE